MKQEDIDMREKKNIVCPCGHLLGTTTNPGGRGEKTCSCCKRRVKFTVTPTKVLTAYIK